MNLTDGIERLSRAIESVEQVEAMDTDELASSLVAHDSEIIRVVGLLESRRLGAHRSPALTQVGRVLRLHRSWIEREVKRRRTAVEQEAAAQARQARAEAHHLAQAKVQADKMARISESNNENMRQLAVFKAVAREVLGAEQYLHLWTLVRQRIATGGQE